MPLLSEGFGRMSIQDQAKFHVRTWLSAHLDKSDPTFHLTNDDIYVVWFAKTLQNWKALVSTTLPDGMYYEVTYNGVEDEAYLDVYKKFDNVCIPDEQDAVSDIPAGAFISTSKYVPAGPDRFA